MNSIIKYFGGKNGMFKNIIENFPEKGTYDTYIEPFGGSFAIGFHTPDDMVAPIEIYNDLEDNVYSLFRVLTDETMFAQFKKLCDCTYYDEKLREIAKAGLKSEDLDVVTRAYYFFYSNRSSHNGIGGFSMNRVVRRNMAKSVSDFLSTVDRLPEIHQRLSKVMVTHKDGIKLIEEYDKPNVFVYADPPYVLSTRNSTARYKVDMTNEEQEHFVEACINTKAKLLISGYDNPLYDKLTENGFTKVQFEVNTITGTHQPKTKTETLWRNY